MFKGIVIIFPKFEGYSVEGVDKVGYRHDSKHFALLANARPSKLIRLPASTCAKQLQVLAGNLYNLIDIALGCDFHKNESYIAR